MKRHTYVHCFDLEYIFLVQLSSTWQVEIFFRVDHYHYHQENLLHNNFSLRVM